MSETVPRDSFDELWATLAGPEVSLPPSRLRERVVAAALVGREAGRPSVDAPVISPVEAFATQVAAFESLLSELDGAEWRKPVLRDLDIQGLVGHLIGVELAFQGSLDAAGVDGRTAPPGWHGDADHITSTQPYAVVQSGRPTELTRDEWRSTATRSVERLRALDPDALDSAMVLHGLPLSIGAMIVVRTFELWTHDEDIRRATARPLAPPGASSLRLMTGLATELLPVAVSRAGGDGPGGIARVVLTGAGGGAWTVTVDAPGSEPAWTRIVADTLEFCRLAAARIPPDAVVATIEGDRDLAARVLSGAFTLALD